MDFNSIYNSLKSFNFWWNIFWRSPDGFQLCKVWLNIQPELLEPVQRRKQKNNDESFAENGNKLHILDVAILHPNKPLLQAKYFWLGEKLDIYGLLAAKCCLNSVFAIWSKLAQTQFTKDSGSVNISFSPELLCSECRVSICRDTERNATLQFTTLQANLQAHKTLMPAHKIKKSSLFVHWPLRSSSKKCRKEVKMKDNGHFCSKLRLT